MIDHKIQPTVYSKYKLGFFGRPTLGNSVTQGAVGFEVG